MDPLRDLSGVGLQQGRILPDADVNVLVDILDRRHRAAVADQRQTGVAQVSKLTPDAFKITASGRQLSIGRGRMYVDGLLAENHGDPAKPVFDPVLAEPTRDGPVSYDAQPYWPTPDPLPDGPGPHLAYLDVWQRELTYLNAPDLVEPAIGVDTTTRTQVVWQVRLFGNVGTGATCGGPIEGWDELIAPSGARLTTGTVPVDPEDDICELPPTGGYRGLENHLYRVELHDATHFKWSRDNASIASTVTEVVSDTELRLARLRRDDLMRFAENDWVEILDDPRELNRLPGELRKISVDEAASTISFTPALPADMIPSGTGEDTLANRHLRVILWNGVDQPVSASPVELEHGVTVAFGGSAGRPGDYWVFAARTTGASVEQLDEAPPRGIHHHYGRLSLVTLPDSAIDCRPSDPTPTGEGCPCEVCVTPEDHASGVLTIQAAIDRAIGAGGGTVDLCPGSYPLREPLRLQNATSIVLRGHGAVVVSNGPAIVAGTAHNVAIGPLAVASVGSGPVVALYNCSLVRVEGLVIGAQSTGDSPDRVGIAIAGPHVLTSLRRNFISADVGIGTMAFDAPGIENHLAPGAPAAKGVYTAGLRIEDNTLQCSRRGVDLTGTAVHVGEVRIATNMSFGTDDAGIAATGLMMRGDRSIDGVLTVAGNDVKTTGGVGILTSGRVVVNDNEITTSRRGAEQHGILVAAEPPGAEPGHVQIIGNRVIGVGGFGIAIEAPLASLLVKQNVVQGAGGGIVVRGPGRKEHVSIDNNHVIDVVAADQGETPGPNLGTATGAFAVGVIQGIAVAGVGAAHLVGNLVDGVGADGSANSAIGMAVILADDVRVSDNTVMRVGSPQRDGRTVGIGVASTTNSVTLQDNTVHSGPTEAESQRPGWRALVVTGTGREGGPTRVIRAGNVGRIAFDGAWLYVKATAETGAPLQLVSNTLYGGGESVAVTLDADGDALLSANRFAQPPGVENPALDLNAPTAVVQGNRAVGGRPSMRLQVSPDSSVVIGNITSGDITVAGTPVQQTGKAWSQLNPVVP
jgi:hypothetical protein